METTLQKCPFGRPFSRAVPFPLLWPDLDIARCFGCEAASGCEATGRIGSGPSVNITFRASDFAARLLARMSEQSTLQTDAGVDQNFQRDFLGAIGPHEFQKSFSFGPSPWSLVFREICVDQWP